MSFAIDSQGAHHMLAIRTILHPTDFSAFAANAFHLSCSLARDYHAKLVILHVMAPPDIAFADGNVPDHTKFLLQELQEQLERANVSAGSLMIERRLEDGEPVGQILHVASEINADLIVMGTHGRTGLSRLLMGSVAEQIVRKSPCPVLTISGHCRNAAMAAPEAEIESRRAQSESVRISAAEPTLVPQPG